ncbi:hypothetical protein SK128_027643 [Halocaridina rubra]|uniref:Uncharacterized protein n=1 Tax=Halocaridina rubra TaxID=373956 RepID=A0AAN8XLJ2_HALRR
MHEVSHEENQRSCSLEPLHRSSSAQSDSSGFMEGDQGEGDSRTVISSQLSCGPFQSPGRSVRRFPGVVRGEVALENLKQEVRDLDILVTNLDDKIKNMDSKMKGHAWWWSRESEGSVETVRYMPPGKPYPLHPGQNFYTHASSAFDQPPSRLLNKCTCCIYSSQICRLHNTSAESHRFARPIPGTDLKTNTSGTDSFAYSPPTDRCNPLCPDLSSDCPLALESFNVNNSHISSPCFSHSAVIPVTCITQSTFNIPSTSVSSIEKSYCCQQHLRKSSGTCHRRRHRSLPEPLVDSSSSAVADLEGKRNSQSFHLLWQPYFQPSSRTTRPGLTTGYLSPSSCQYSSPSLTPLQPVQSHLPYQSYSFANSSGLSSNQLPLKGNNISRKTENSVNDRHSDHAYMEQSTPEILLSALQSYRVQLVQQEHLSHSLHKAASYFTDNTSHQFAQELRSISAIRAAIRAEVTHMEEIIFNSKPRVLNSTCVNKVMLQMLVLMQKQAELCHVIERLTITSPVSSPKSEPLTSKDFPITGQDSSKQLADAGCTNEKMKHTSYPGGSTSHNVALVTGSVNYSLDSRLTEANHDQQNRNSQASKLSQNDHGQSHMWLRNQSCKEANSSSSDIYMCSNADNSLLNSGNILRKEDISNNNSSDSCVHPSQEENEPQSIPSSSPTTSNDIEWIMNTVKYQVQSQTQVVEAQLIHQSKEMEDMKKMLHLILNKLQ